MFLPSLLCLLQLLPPTPVLMTSCSPSATVWSTSGNIYALTGGSCPSARALAINQGRFSNGYNAADYLRLGAVRHQRDTLPARWNRFRVRRRAAPTTNANAHPRSRRQVQAFSRRATAGKADPNALVFHQRGRQRRVRAGSRRERRADVRTGRRRRSRTRSRRLRRWAREHFLVDNVFDLGNTPVIVRQGAVASAYGTRRRWPSTRRSRSRSEGTDAACGRYAATVQFLCASAIALTPILPRSGWV